MGQALYTGPKGLCRDCGKETFIRLGSMVGKVKERAWEIHPELMQLIYSDIRRATVMLSRGKLEVRCPACIEDPIVQTPKASKLMWVALDGVVGDAPSGMLIGPFCNQCFKVRRRKFESQDGLAADLPVYYVTVTQNNLEIVRETPRPVEIPPEDEPSRGGEPDDSGAAEVGGLF